MVIDGFLAGTGSEIQSRNYYRADTATRNFLEGKVSMNPDLDLWPDLHAYVASGGAGSGDSPKRSDLKLAADTAGQELGEQMAASILTGFKDPLQHEGSTTEPLDSNEIMRQLGQLMTFADKKDPLSLKYHTHIINDRITGDKEVALRKEIAKYVHRGYLTALGRSAQEQFHVYAPKELDRLKGALV